MNVGTLEIQMAMDMLRLRQDMTSAKDVVTKTIGDINGAADTMKRALGAAFLGLSVNSFAGMINGAIEAQAAMHDMAQSTGLSVAALAEFKKVGAYTETSADSIAGAMLKLSKNMALTDEEGQGAALAIKALGLDFNSFKKLDPDRQLLEVAQAMKGFKDGADKSAAAMLLFGKEGAKLIPFMGDLADSADEITAVLTEQEKASRAAAAAMADAYGDNLTKIHKVTDDWKRGLSQGLLPAMYEATEAFVQMTGGAGGIRAEINRLASDGTLAEWARGAVTAFTYLIDVGQGVFDLLQMLGKTIAGVVAGTVQLFGGIGTAMRQFIEGDYSKSIDTMKGAFVEVKTIGESTASDVSEIWNRKLIGETFRETMAGLKGIQVDGKKTKEELELEATLARNKAGREAETAATKLAAEETKKLIAMYEAADKAGQDLLASLELKNEQLQLEVDLGRKLTPIETENLKLTKDMATSKVLLSEADERAARAEIARGAGLEQTRAIQEVARKEIEEATKAVDKQIESLVQETDRQREQNEALGMTREQLDALQTSRYLALAAQADAIAQNEEETKGCTALSAQQRELAEAYRERAAVGAEGTVIKEAKEAQDAWQKTIDSVGQGLTDSLFRAFEAGKGFWSTLWDGIKNTVKSTVLKVAIQGADGKGGIAGSIMQMIGLGAPGAGGAGAGGIGGGLGSLGGVGNALGSLFGSGGWMTNFGGNVTGLAGDAGMWLMEKGFDQLGSSLLGNASAIGDLAGIAGDAFGYLGALKSAADGKWGAAVGSGIGTFFGGPIGGTIGNLIGGGLDKLFGGNGTHHAGAGYVSDGATGFDVRSGGYGLGWSYGDSVNKYFSQDIQDALKTITGGSASMLNSLSKAFGGDGGFQTGAWFASDNDRDSMGNRSVLLDGRVLSEWAGGGLDKDASKGLQQLTDALAGQVRSAMGQIDLPAWAKEQLDALGSGVTMDKLAQTVLAIQQSQAALAGLGDFLAPLGGAFARIAGLSAEAQLELVGFAGGIDAFVAKTRSFVEGYYSDDEKYGLQARDVSAALADLGISGDDLKSRADFRALVEEQAERLNTTADRKQFDQLLSISQAFLPLAQYLEQQDGGLSLSDLAAQAPQSDVLQLLADQQATTQAEQLNASQTLNTSVVSIGDQITASIGELGISLAARLAAVEEAIQRSGQATRDAYTFEAVR